MESQRGVTLTSLVIYIIVLLIIVGILGTITATLQGNIKEIYREGTNNAEIDKFNVYFLKEVKKQGNEIYTISENEIIFTTGSKYTFSNSDKSIYLNNNIKIAENIETCRFFSKEEYDKTIIVVTIEAIKGEEKIIEYVLSNRAYSPSYEDESMLPYEYKELEYIESTGTQYIDTLINPTNNMSVDMTIQLKTTGGDQKFFGSYGSGNGCQLGVLGDKWRAGNGGWQISGQNSILATLDKTRIAINGNTWTFNNEDLSFENLTITEYESSILLCGVKYLGNVFQYANIKVYYLKIYDNEILVRNMIPCYRKSDNEVGMYDTVNDEFYNNQGTGDFIAGPEN